MTTLSQLPTSDLILRVTGGPRSGELIPVSTPKCYLGMESNNDAISKNPQCVIFRGREGAVIRSYADKVTLNNAAASLHWLQEGDAIRFPNQMKIEVVQLGELKDLVSPGSSNSKSSVLAENSLEASLVILESELRSIQVQNGQSQTQLDQLDSRLNNLAQQMTMLINLSSSGTGVQVSQTSQFIAAPESSSLATATEIPVVETEKNINSPIQNRIEAESADETTTTDEATATDEATTTQDVATTPQSSAIESTLAEQLSVENSTTEESAEQSTSPVDSPEVLQSPVENSPLEELDRIDKAIEESVTGYYSHTDQSDEQILTFDGDSATSAEPGTSDNTIEAKNVVTEEQIVSPVTASSAMESSAESTDSDNVAEEAKALAEKEERLSEMERIFGGALDETETDQQEATPETPSADQPVQTESTESIQSVGTTQPAGEQLAKTFEDLPHGPNAEVDSSADNLASTDSEESVVSEQIQESASQDIELTSAASDQDQGLESRLSPMARQLLQDVKSEQVEEGPEAAKMPVMLPPSERVGSQTVVFPMQESKNEDEQNEVTQGEAQQSSADDSSEPEAEELESGLSPMAQQLLQDVKTEESEEQSKDIELPVMVPMSERIESETVIFPKAEGNESVADILARMKEDGKWDGVPSDDTPVDPVKPVEAAEPVVAEPDEEESNLDSSADADGDDGDDMEAYMSRLLSRTRGEEPAVETKAKKKKETKKTKKTKETKADKKEVEKPVFEKPADPLKAEDFKPKQKAKKIKSLSAMRELANSNTQTNIHVSEVRNKLERSASLLIAMGFAGLVLSVCYFIFGSATIGMCCLGIPAACGLLFYITQQTGKGKKSKSSKSTTTANAEVAEESSEPTEG